jgi:hypothetical protein
MTIQGGSAAAPSLTFSGDTNTGIFSPAADTIAFSEGGVESMRIDASGNVGIGNPSPQYQLDLNKTGSTTLFGSGINAELDSADIALKLTSWGGSGGRSGSIRFLTGAGVSAGTVTERARIDSSGGLRVNTTGTLISASEILSVNSTGNSFAVRTSAGTTGWCQLNWNSGTSGNNLFLEFGTEAAYTARGSIDYNRGAGQVRYNQTSDATLKNIIGDSDGQKSVEILNSTRIREYAWKDDDTQKPQIGVIAQELYETYKGAVFVGGEQEDGKYRPWGVDKTAFTFHLIAGWQVHEKLIQEQQQMIEELKAELDATKAEVALLKGAA